MNAQILVSIVAAFAANHPEGFTYNIETSQDQTTGFAVACKETQNSFGNDGLERVANFVLENKVVCIGGWCDVESGLYYYDATIIVDTLEKAILLGRLNEQIAVFDLNTMQEVRF